jgi:hypothetical protein
MWREFDRRILSGEANRVRKKQSSAIIAADVMRFGHVINMDGVLGTHRHQMQGNQANQSDRSVTTRIFTDSSLCMYFTNPCLPLDLPHDLATQ